MRLSLFFILLFSVNTIHLLSAQDSKVNQSPKSSNQEEETFEFVDVFPRFYNAECEAMDGPDNEKKACSDMKLRAYLAKQVGYPKSAREAGHQGTVYIRFVVMEDGQIAHIEILKNMTESKALADVSFRAVESMNELEKRWTPGYQNGEAVRVRIIIPIKFQLRSNEPEEKKKWWQRFFGR